MLFRVNLIDSILKVNDRTQFFCRMNKAIGSFHIRPASSFVTQRAKEQFPPIPSRIRSHLDPFYLPAIVISFLNQSEYSFSLRGLFYRFAIVISSP